MHKYKLHPVSTFVCKIECLMYTDQGLRSLFLHFVDGVQLGKLFGES